jgi:hypothetical protein
VVRIRQKIAFVRSCSEIASSLHSWQPSFILFDAGGGTPYDPLMRAITIQGEATSLAHIKDAFIISDITGEKEELRVWFPQTNETKAVDHVNIPDASTIYVTFEFKPNMPLHEFVSKWNISIQCSVRRWPRI